MYVYTQTFGEREVERGGSKEEEKERGGEDLGRARGYRMRICILEDIIIPG